MRCISDSIGDKRLAYLKQIEEQKESISIEDILWEDAFWNINWEEIMVNWNSFSKAYYNVSRGDKLDFWKLSVYGDDSEEVTIKIYVWPVDFDSHYLLWFDNMYLESYQTWNRIYPDKSFASLWATSQVFNEVIAWNDYKLVVRLSDEVDQSTFMRHIWSQWQEV